MRIVTEEVWRYVVLFQLKREKDDGKYEIMMAVTMTQQEGPTACPEKPCQPPHPFVLDSVGGCATRSLVLPSNREV